MADNKILINIKNKSEEVKYQNNKYDFISKNYWGTYDNNGDLESFVLYFDIRDVNGEKITSNKIDDDHYYNFYVADNKDNRIYLYPYKFISGESFINDIYGNNTEPTASKEPGDTDYTILWTTGKVNVNNGINFNLSDCITLSAGFSPIEYYTNYTDKLINTFCKLKYNNDEQYKIRFSLDAIGNYKNYLNISTSNSENTYIYTYATVTNSEVNKIFSYTGDQSQDITYTWCPTVQVDLIAINDVYAYTTAISSSYNIFCDKYDATNINAETLLYYNGDTPNNFYIPFNSDSNYGYYSKNAGIWNTDRLEWTLADKFIAYEITSKPVNTDISYAIFNNSYYYIFEYNTNSNNNKMISTSSAYANIVNINDYVANLSINQTSSSIFIDNYSQQIGFKLDCETGAAAPKTVTGKIFNTGELYTWSPDNEQGFIVYYDSSKYKPKDENIYFEKLDEFKTNQVNYECNTGDDPYNNTYVMTINDYTFYKLYYGEDDKYILLDVGKFDPTIINTCLNCLLNTIHYFSVYVYIKEGNKYNKETLTVTIDNEYNITYKFDTEADHYIPNYLTVKYENNLTEDTTYNTYVINNTQNNNGYYVNSRSLVCVYPENVMQISDTYNIPDIHVTAHLYGFSVIPIKYAFSFNGKSYNDITKINDKLKGVDGFTNWQISDTSTYGYLNSELSSMGFAIQQNNPYTIDFIDIPNGYYINNFSIDLTTYNESYSTYNTTNYYTYNGNSKYTYLNGENKITIIQPSFNPKGLSENQIKSYYALPVTYMSYNSKFAYINNAITYNAAYYDYHFEHTYILGTYTVADSYISVNMDISERKYSYTITVGYQTSVTYTTNNIISNTNSEDKDILKTGYAYATNEFSTVAELLKKENETLSLLYSNISNEFINDYQLSENDNKKTVNINSILVSDFKITSSLGNKETDLLKEVIGNGGHNLIYKQYKSFKFDLKSGITTNLKFEIQYAPINDSNNYSTISDLNKAGIKINNDYICFNDSEQTKLGYYAQCGNYRAKVSHASNLDWHSFTSDYILLECEDKTSYPYTFNSISSNITASDITLIDNNKTTISVTSKYLPIIFSDNKQFAEDWANDNIYFGVQNITSSGDDIKYEITTYNTSSIIPETLNYTLKLMTTEGDNNYTSVTKKVPVKLSFSQTLLYSLDKTTWKRLDDEISIIHEDDTIIYFKALYKQGNKNNYTITFNNTSYNLTGDTDDNIVQYEIPSTTNVGTYQLTCNYANSISKVLYINIYQNKLDTFKLTTANSWNDIDHWIYPPYDNIDNTVLSYIYVTYSFNTNNVLYLLVDSDSKHDLSIELDNTSYISFDTSHDSTVKTASYIFMTSYYQFPNQPASDGRYEKNIYTKIFTHKVGYTKAKFTSYNYVTRLTSTYNPYDASSEATAYFTDNQSAIYYTGPENSYAKTEKDFWIVVQPAANELTYTSISTQYNTDFDSTYTFKDSSASYFAYTHLNNSNVCTINATDSKFHGFAKNVGNTYYEVKTAAGANTYGVTKYIPISISYRDIENNFDAIVVGAKYADPNYSSTSSNHHAAYTISDGNSISFRFNHVNSYVLNNAPLSYTLYSDSSYINISSYTITPTLDGNGNTQIAYVTFDSNDSYYFSYHLISRNTYAYITIEPVDPQLSVVDKDKNQKTSIIITKYGVNSELYISDDYKGDISKLKVSLESGDCINANIYIDSTTRALRITPVKYGTNAIIKISSPAQGNYAASEYELTISVIVPATWYINDNSNQEITINAEVYANNRLIIKIPRNAGYNKDTEFSIDKVINKSTSEIVDCNILLERYDEDMTNSIYTFNILINETKNTTDLYVDLYTTILPPVPNIYYKFIDKNITIHCKKVYNENTITHDNVFVDSSNHYILLRSDHNMIDTNVLNISNLISWKYTNKNYDRADDYESTGAITYNDAIIKPYNSVSLNNQKLCVDYNNQALNIRTDFYLTPNDINYNSKTWAGISITTPTYVTDLEYYKGITVTVGFNVMPINYNLVFDTFTANNKNNLGWSGAKMISGNKNATLICKNDKLSLEWKNIARFNNSKYYIPTNAIKLYFGDTDVTSQYVRINDGNYSITVDYGIINNNVSILLDSNVAGDYLYEKYKTSEASNDSNLDKEWVSFVYANYNSVQYNINNTLTDVTGTEHINIKASKINYGNSQRIREVNFYKVKDDDPEYSKLLQTIYVSQDAHDEFINNVDNLLSTTTDDYGYTIKDNERITEIDPETSRAYVQYNINGINYIIKTNASELVNGLNLNWNTEGVTNINDLSDLVISEVKIVNYTVDKYLDTNITINTLNKNTGTAIVKVIDEHKDILTQLLKDNYVYLFIFVNYDNNYSDNTRTIEFNVELNSETISFTNDQLSIKDNDTPTVTTAPYTTSTSTTTEAPTTTTSTTTPAPTTSTTGAPSENPISILYNDETLADGTNIDVTSNNNGELIITLAATADTEYSINIEDID